MQFYSTTIILIFLAISPLLTAQEQLAAKDTRVLDPNSPDIIGQFRQIGLPKHTDVEKQIISRAQKLQEQHAAIFQKIELGKSIFDYPGLISMGAIHHERDAKNPYNLTIGICPHIAEFAESFHEFVIEFDDKGIIRKKTQKP